MKKIAVLAIAALLVVACGKKEEAPAPVEQAAAPVVEAAPAPVAEAPAADAAAAPAAQ